MAGMKGLHLIAPAKSSRRSARQAPEKPQPGHFSPVSRFTGQTVKPSRNGSHMRRRKSSNAPNAKTPVVTALFPAPLRLVDFVLDNSDENDRYEQTEDDIENVIVGGDSAAGIEAVDALCRIISEQRVSDRSEEDGEEQDRHRGELALSAFLLKLV